MEGTMNITDTGDIERVFDANNRDVLVCRRVEIFLAPNEDATSGTDGRVLWHTEWWHYTGAARRGETLGPRLESSLLEVTGNQHDVGATDPLPVPAIVAGIKTAYMQCASKHFRPGEAKAAAPEPEVV